MFLLSSSSIPSGSRGTRTHKRLPATCFQDRLLIQPDDFRIQMDVLRRQELNLRTRGSKPRISTSRNYSASGGKGFRRVRLNCAGCFFNNAKAAVTGIEPTRPPWQGSRLPLHHGRKKNRLRSEGLEPSPIRLKAEDAATNTSISYRKLRPDHGCLRSTPYRI